MTERLHATWGELLLEAVEKPGRMLEAYTAFHSELNVTSRTMYLNSSSILYTRPLIPIQKFYQP